MRNHIFLASFFLAIGSGVACNEGESPENKPGEFGDPCTPGANVDTPDGCVAEMECYKGYCEENCADNTDCQPIEGWDHICVAGLCQILCDVSSECPQSLATSLTCESVGSARLCKAKDESS